MGAEVRVGEDLEGECWTSDTRADDGECFGTGHGSFSSCRGRMRKLGMK